MKKALGLLLLVSAVMTYASILVGNLFVCLWFGGTLASIVGPLCMITVIWQIHLSYKMFRS